MYIYQNGKLYAQVGEKLVGVNISPDSISKVKGTETKLGKNFLILTPREVQAKFNISEEHSYEFPIEKPEVVEDEPTKPVKKPVGRPKRK